jgi:hypothetical protein
MRCDEFSERLFDLLDERRAAIDDPGLVAHMSECGNCRALAATIDRAVDLIEPVPTLSASLGDRVVAQLARERATPASGAGAWLIGSGRKYVAALAASLVLAVTAYWLVERSDRVAEKAEPPQAPAIVSAPPPVAPGDTATESLAFAAVDDYQTLALELAQETGASVASALAIVSPVAPVEVAQAEAPANEGIGDSLGRAIGESFSPLAETATGAMSTLWHVLPSAREGTRS